MDEDNKISATATASSAEEALSSAESKARQLLRQKYPDSMGAVGTVGWVSSPDGTHTATVSFSPADFPDGWDPDSVVEASKAPKRMPGKHAIQRRLLEILGPPLAAKGFTLVEEKLLYSKRVSDQMHCVHLGVHRKCFSLSTRLYLDEVAEFYRTFENDPRTYRQLSTLNEVFRDFDYPDGDGEANDTVSQSSIEAAERDIVSLLTEQVIPWFDDFPSLILVKGALERQEHNAVKHESLLPMYFLLGDRAGLEKYLKQCLSEIKTTNQPKQGQFQRFYVDLRAKYSEFFPELAP